jgi:hypothetical protein
VLLAYVAFVGAIHSRGHPFHDLSFTGLHFVQQSSASPRINVDAAFAKPGTGYDGQFFLFIAQDPAHARYYLDDAAYRYGRIVYPLAARAIALGQAEWIPAALVVFNVLAITLGTFAVARWLTRRGSSPWLALFFGLFPGVFISVLRDLSEGAAYSFAALAFVTFDARRRRRLLASALLFALAILTRETTAVFALAAAVPLLFSGSRTRDVRGAAAFLALSLGPYVVWRSFIHVWLGSSGIPTRLLPSPVPFGGIGHWPFNVGSIQQVLGVALPGTFCLGIAIWAMWRRSFEPPVLALAANALLFVVLLPWPSYDEFYASLRISTAVVLSLLLAVPILDRLLGPGRTWFWLPMIAWFAAWWQLFPIPFQEPGGFGW